MQSLLEVTPRVEGREFFRRPQRTDAVPMNRLDRTLSKPASSKAHARLHRKISDIATKTFRSPLQGFHQTRSFALVKYPIVGSNLIETIRYTTPDQETDKGLVWINQTQYFEGVSSAVWNYSLGGRQICQRWLQDRQGSTLCEQSIQQYQQIVMILKDVIDLMAGIDGAFQAQQLHSSDLLAAFSH